MLERRMTLEEFDPLAWGPGITRVLARAVDDPVADLPLVAVVGRHPGPMFIAAAGVHGDEYEGPAGAVAIADLRPEEMHGTLVAMPICNPWAARGSVRPPHRSTASTSPERFRVMRTGRRRSASRRRSSRVSSASARRCFWTCTAAASQRRYHPVVGIRGGLGDEARSRAAARAFGLPTLWTQRSSRDLQRRDRAPPGSRPSAWR